MTGAAEPDSLPDEAYAVALARLSGMGPARLATLIGRWGPAHAWAVMAGTGADAERIWLQELANSGGRRQADLAATWRREARGTEVATLWARVAELGIGVALRGRSGYPQVLDDDIEPPATLFHQGDPGALWRPRVAIVGTRRCTAVGRGVAHNLGRDLATAGVAVISGLATGVDAASHLGALESAAAAPVGVVATGLDVIYPARHRELWSQVARKGWLVSEAPPGTQPERWRFPARNRIIAALADIVVVVESHQAGGALYTVDEADERSVQVMAVPGSVRSPASAGTNALLAEGRAPARDAADVLLALGMSGALAAREVESRPPPSPEDAAVLDHLGWQPTGLDQMVLRSGLGVVPTAAALGRLVDAGWVTEAGGWYERTMDP